MRDEALADRARKMRDDSREKFHKLMEEAKREARTIEVIDELFREDPPHPVKIMFDEWVDANFGPIFAEAASPLALPPERGAEQTLIGPVRVPPEPNPVKRKPKKSKSSKKTQLEIIREVLEISDVESLSFPEIMVLVSAEYPHVKRRSAQVVLSQAVRDKASWLGVERSGPALRYFLKEGPGPEAQGQGD